MGHIRGRSAILHFCFLILISLQIVYAQDGRRPKVKRAEFERLPEDLQYFEDSNVVLVQVLENSRGVVHRSTDAGASWQMVPELEDEDVEIVRLHSYDKKSALAIGKDMRHWFTTDTGDQWREFTVSAEPRFISFHADDANKAIMSFDNGSALYTTNGFKDLKLLRNNVHQCLWAKEQDLFNTDNEEIDKNRVLCVAAGQYSKQETARRLLVSDDYFENEFEPKLNLGRPVAGIQTLVNVKGYTLAAQKAEGSDEMALYVSKNATVWHRAHFGGHKLKEGAYTALESTNYSLQIAVMSETSKAGVLFTSNSVGSNLKRIRDSVNRIEAGYMDFEKIAGVQGVTLINSVDNYEEILTDADAPKLLISQITFDDGRTFQNLKAGEEDLHVHGYTEGHNSGRVFSSPAPGLVMAVGNTGDLLEDYNRADLYVSTDAGETWKKARDGPHKYEFGGIGAIFLAISDSGDATSKMAYSLDYGQEWVEFSLGEKDEGEKIKPVQLTTTPDSTSPRFVLIAESGSGSGMRYWIYSIDFSDIDIRQCEKDDFERWTARVNDEGDAGCIMGNTQSYRRRKQDTKCLVHSDFKDPEPRFDNKPCVCTKSDFECDAGFERAEDESEFECYLEEGRTLQPQKGECENKSGEATFMSTSGIRKIPGNNCHGGVDLVGDKEWACDSIRAPLNGKITTEETRFSSSSGFKEYYYLEKAATSEDQDESVVMLTDELDLYMTQDHGKLWEHLEYNEEVVAIYPNKYATSSVYFLTRSKRVLYSKDSGKSVHHFDAPGPPSVIRSPTLRFHPKNEDWLIWTTCPERANDCLSTSHVSTKNGREWEVLLNSVENCEFIWNEERSKIDDSTIYCVHIPTENKNGARALYTSNDYFAHHETPFDDILEFATMSEFIVVAAKNKTSEGLLQIESSVNGEVFAPANFPSDFGDVRQTAYTVLDSSTHAIFLHVTTHSVPEQEFGTIIKSNSNGTFFVSSITGVNRNIRGYVDFEKMMGLDGVALVNVVDNIDEVKNDQESKKLKSMMTHNDGGEWSYIAPPEKDANGEKYECNGSLEKCSLHLHGYIDRRDPRDTLSSASAVGVMVGVGNVGEFLGRKRDGDTFISRDGGFTWKTAKNGVYMWEFGDQGSVIVLVEEDAQTNILYYSLNEGETWEEYSFMEKEIRVTDITTVPSDTSLNFLLWGKDSSGSPITVNVDFSGLFTRLCNLDPENPESEDSDYELWEPKHKDDQCLFGHRARYLRKKPSKTDCFNGPKLDRLHEMDENCPCTRSDFECDYNFERQNDGTCKLVSGLEPLAPILQCENKDVDEYSDVTGYRRIPLSTCVGGKEMDKSDAHPCPGKEEKFAKKHGISGVGLFFAIFIPILAASGVGYWVYKKYQGNFGRIRLGSGIEGASNSISRRTNWLAIPIMVVSAAATAVMAIPMILGSLARVAKERFGRGGRAGGFSRAGGAYTSRGSFARGRGDYTAVAASNDERDLLGEESEDEV